MNIEVWEKTIFKEDGKIIKLINLKKLILISKGGKSGESEENKKDEKVIVFKKNEKAELIKLKKLDILIKNISEFKL